MSTPLDASPMDTKWLHEHPMHLQAHLVHFHQMQQQFDRVYPQSLQQIQDRQARSILMGSYCIHQNRQQQFVQAIGQLDQQALNQVANL